MTYEGVVYFAGAMTLWGGEVSEKEVIFRASSKHLWIVRLRTLSAYGPLDHERCGYEIRQGALLLEWRKAGDELPDAAEVRA